MTSCEKDFPRAGVRLIAFDLDGTLLNSNKELTPASFAALARAAEAGIEIVPATGRFLNAIPEAIRALPFLRYAITVNGARVVHIPRDFSIARAEIPWEQALEIMSHLDGLSVPYDCFMEDWGWMTREYWERAEAFAFDEHYLKMIRTLRTPVDDLKAFVRARRRNVQKIQCFTWDMDLRAELLRALSKAFPGVVASSSIPNNVEINDARAHKGEALRKLADYLGISMSRTLAFGDGLNDLTMIQAAGIGVATRTGYQEALDAADFVTSGCDEDGVAAGIERFCF